ncbi:hypothetical protein [Streptomyces sp. NPDC006134]|uniref:hypothetical protein n=1 Tax=Streptomyces sp. NPDC006134 TaxID=3154467 RepID=UPI0033E17409
MRIPFFTDWNERRKLRNEFSYLALDAFYKALDDIDALEAKVEAEREKAANAIVQAKVTALAHRAMNHAVAEFAELFDNSDLAADQAGGFKCAEVEALAALLAAAGRPAAGEMWLEFHKVDEADGLEENAEVIEDAEVVAG